MINEFEQSERKDAIDDAAQRIKRERWSDVAETFTIAAIGAGLAWWAYGTTAHTILFGLLFFSITGVGNRIVNEMRRARIRDDLREIERRHRDQRHDSRFR